MSLRFILASAGAGKTTTIVDEAIEAAGNGRSVLLLTYTKNNQIEIQRKIREIHGAVPNGISIKGWFSFLLEDFIRPYQRCYFAQRIGGIVFDSRDPHMRGNRRIPGRSERLNNAVNPRHYLSNDKAHTTYISKLATLICDHGKVGRGSRASYPVIDRLSAIYDLIIIDEVQDLVGWDFTVLDRLLTSTHLDLCCVGDFRQTIYQTSHARKDPQSSEQKKQWFRSKGFRLIEHNHSWRCLQEICAFSDTVHEHQQYEPTTSNVRVVPEQLRDHTGVFTVSTENLDLYKQRFNPVILRHSRNTRQDLCGDLFTQNFGESKGQSFERVLIFPTENYRRYLRGDLTGLRSARTEEALNKLYVAITRARYSVAFLTDEDPRIDGISVWNP